MFLIISRNLPKFMSNESVMPSSYLILCCPLLLPSVFPSIRVFSHQLAVCIKCPKYWRFSFSISPSNEYSGLISFKIDWLVSFLSKGLSRAFSSTIILMRNRKMKYGLNLLSNFMNPFHTERKISKWFLNCF